MKKIILSLVAIAAFGVANAQEKNEGGQTSKGKWLIGTAMACALRCGWTPSGRAISIWRFTPPAPPIPRPD